MTTGFRRATVGHASRGAEQEVWLTHYEGRGYNGLIRHLTLPLAALGFVAAHTDRLGGKNPDLTLKPVCRALDARCVGYPAGGGVGGDPTADRRDRIPSTA